MDKFQCVIVGDVYCILSGNVSHNVLCTYYYSLLFTVVFTVPTVTIHFNTSTLTVDEGSNIDIQLVAQGTFDQNFTVNLTFTDGTAGECLL